MFHSSHDYMAKRSHYRIMIFFDFRVLLYGHTPTVIRHYFCSYFAVHFRPNFTSHSLPHTFFPYAFTLTNRQQRTQFDWYDRTLNNSTTGLPTFQNSPAVVLPHLDPVREPLLLPPNAPTTQSSGLPELGAQVGVRPSCEYSW